MAKCLLNLWRTGGERNYGQSRTEMLCWWLHWKELLMWVCEELERKFRGNQTRPRRNIHLFPDALHKEHLVIQEHQTLIGFQKWGAKKKEKEKEGLICISRSPSINFSMQMTGYLKWNKTKINKMILNLPVALEASLCQWMCLPFLEAQVKGTGMMPPGEGYWDCRKSERR